MSECDLFDVDSNIQHATELLSQSSKVIYNVQSFLFFLLNT